MTGLTCLQCGTPNRIGARYCQHCGEILTNQPTYQSALAGLVHPNARYVPVGNPLDLIHSIYHRAYALTCGECQQTNVPNNGEEKCQHCQAPLPPVLLRQARRKLSSDDVHNVVALSADSPYILPHLDVVRWPAEDAPADGDTYLVLADPVRPWRSPVKLPTPVAPEQVKIWARQIGQAMGALHDRGFGLYDVDSAGLEGIIIDGDDVAGLADLSSATRLSVDDPQLVQQQIGRDTAFLATFIHFLTTGHDLKRRPSTGRLPPELRTVVERAVRGEYGSMAAMLAALGPSRPAGAPAAFERPLRPACGMATHRGRVPQYNQDAVVVFQFWHEPGAVPVGLYLIADGMGGQAAGEVASKAINRVVARQLLERQVIRWLDGDTGKLTESSAALLTEAIQQANQTVVEMNQQDGKNMGAVVTAALIVGERATIANVGDSRAYLVQDGQLTQITTDHSLVARLVETGTISSDELRTHPNRSQVYRSLGEKMDVEIDIHLYSLQAGDALLLCCDGLWEMLPDGEIQRIVGASASPQAACDELVRSANAAGGEDNISVIVVEIE